MDEVFTIGRKLAEASANKIILIANNVKECDDDCTDCDPCKEKNQSHSIVLNTTISRIANWDEIEGQRHLVVPVVMAVQGVMNNILYTNEELKKFPDMWNGRMVPISHPENSQGTKVTINTPEAINEYNVGLVLNAKYTEDNGQGKLSAEIWINEALANLKAPGLLTNLQVGNRVEISTGLHGDFVWEGGIFNGKNYAAKLVNFRPDHLAILLDEEGACSLADGCGLNTNSEGKNEMTKKKISLTEWIKSKLGFSIQDNSVHGLAHNDIRESLRMLLQEKHKTDETSVFIEEVFDDVVVYEIFGDGIATLFQTDYNINSNDQVSLANDIPVEVQKKTDFVPVTTAQDPLNINQETKTEEKESLMNDDERKAVVDKIIANEALPFDEKDRDALNKYDDEKLNKFSEIVPPVTTNEGDEEDPKKSEADTKVDPEKDKKVETEVTTNQDEASENSDVKKLTKELQEAIKSIPELVSNAVKTEKDSNEKAPIIANLLANKQNVLAEDTLKAMGADELRKYQAQITPMVRFGAQGGNTESMQINAAEDDGPGDMPEMEFEAVEA